MTVKTPLIKHKKLVIVLSIILAVAILVSATVIVFVKIGEARLREELTFENEGLTEEDAYEDADEVFYNGNSYVYNEDLINILCIGVDKANTKEHKDRQADALYLLSLDTNKKLLNVLAISRNTLADIDVYDMDNDFLGTEKAQICLSYVYGKDDKHSTLLTCEAVSRLLYDLPINAYYTVFMDAIGEIVDAVDGVEVVIPDDMTAADSNWKKGRKINLNRNNVLKFIQHRGETHAPRLERQKLFINNFINRAKVAFKNDVTVPISLYKSIAKNSVTNIKLSEISYLATQMANARFKMHAVSGETGFDGMYETFEVDEAALYESVLNLFYIKTN